MTGRYLRDRGVRRAYVLGNRSLRTELRNAGIRHPEASAAAAVVGDDHALTFEALTPVTRAINRDDLPIIAVNADSVVPSPQGIIPGVGAIVRALEAATERRATIGCKPEPYLFNHAVDALGTTNFSMVGDSPSIDVQGANPAGFTTILATRHEHTGDGEDADATVATLLGLFDPPQSAGE